MKRILLSFIIMTILVTCLFILTGCGNKVSTKETNQTENYVTQDEVVEKTEVENNSSSKYGFISKVNEEKLTVDLENDPRPESLKIAQAVEKNLIDNGYKIASIDFDGYGSALTIKIIMDDNLRVSLVYKSDDTLNSINAFGSNDETLLPMAKVIVGTEILGFSEEDRTTMFNSPDGTFTVGKWAGYIDDSQSSRAGRIFKLYITNK